MNKYIKVKVQVDGIHRYENAKAKHAYLSYDHRHTFHVMVKMQVLHNDREVEFFALKDHIVEVMEQQYDVNGNLFQFEGDSCEQIATEVLLHIEKMYHLADGRKRDILVTVSEDGDNEAEIDNYDSDKNSETEHE